MGLIGSNMDGKPTCHGRGGAFKTPASSGRRRQVESEAGLVRRKTFAALLLCCIVLLT